MNVTAIFSPFQNRVRRILRVRERVTHGTPLKSDLMGRQVRTGNFHDDLNYPQFIAIFSCESGYFECLNAV